jgi:hypothetical protein
MLTRKLPLAWMIVVGVGLGIVRLMAAGSLHGIDGAAAFERLKTLQGTWEAAGKDGTTAKTTFELVATGTVLLERYSNSAMPGGGQMVTAYHLDGQDLVLTHYCIAKNQPTLKAERFDTATGRSSSNSSGRRTSPARTPATCAARSTDSLMRPTSRPNGSSSRTGRRR